MKTIISSATKEVIISPDGPVTLIGEKINPTGRKRMAQSLRDGNFDYVRRLAIGQSTAGADILDVNAGVPGLNEAELLPELVKLVANETDLPLCIDSSDPKALAAALTVAPGRPLVNSVNGEEAMLEAILPLVKDRNAAVIGLAMDDDGIPKDAESRVAIAEKILERAARIGIAAEDVIIDPLVMTVGADAEAAVVTLQTIAMLRERFGVNITMGASNVSFGLPERHTLNQAFLTLAVQAGATSFITNPGRLGIIIRAAELLLGRDQYARQYLALYRKQKK